MLRVERVTTGFAARVKQGAHLAAMKPSFCKLTLHILASRKAFNPETHGCMQTAQTGFGMPDNTEGGNQQGGKKFSATLDHSPQSGMLTSLDSPVFLRFFKIVQRISS